MRRSRALAAVAIAAMAATGAAACSSASSSSSSTSAASTSTPSGSSSSAPTASITAWVVTTSSAGQTSPTDAAVKALATAFDNAHPGDQVNIQFVQNDPYKQKIALAMTAGNEPQIFWTWGGGPLQQDIKAGKVTPLATTAEASSSASYLSKFLPSSLGAVTVNGNVYGVPIEGTQPVYFFYNKSVFSKYGLTFPTTWAQMLSDVKTFKAHGVAPFSLAGGASWTELMYLEYLVDRIGGPTVAQDLQSNKPGAWSEPAVTQALTDIQQLVSDGAFQTGYSAAQFNGTTDALVYTGKAAMQLMGDWDIGSLVGEDDSFVTSGQLGMAPFPTVAGGTGNPADLAGNTASYVAISNNGTPAQIAVAKEFFQDELASSSYAAAEVQAGEVPVTSGASSLFTGSMASFDTTIYGDVQSAPSFQYSWDQAMTPGVSTLMLTNLTNIFLNKMTPAAFVSSMNAQATKDASGS
jgi:raffinose/stachyose/melibiose transport system substrate-binding protein